MPRKQPLKKLDTLHVLGKIARALWVGTNKIPQRYAYLGHSEANFDTDVFNHGMLVSMNLRSRLGLARILPAVSTAKIGWTQMKFS